MQNQIHSQTISKFIRQKIPATKLFINLLLKATRMRYWIVS